MNVLTRMCSFKSSALDHSAKLPRDMVKAASTTRRPSLAGCRCFASSLNSPTRYAKHVRSNLGPYSRTPKRASSRIDINLLATATSINSHQDVIKY